MCLNLNLTYCIFEQTYAGVLTLLTARRALIKFKLVFDDDKFMGQGQT